MWVTKQTVISRSEPELGLGTITLVDPEEGILEALFVTSVICLKTATNFTVPYQVIFEGEKEWHWEA